ncbi:MAG TPA: TRAP transporter small permease [Rhizobiales bacterium]|nr:TRAP transporter small permease [Hyphomicrobiales bacterium]
MGLGAGIERAARIWALLGGILLLLIVFVTVLDIVLGGVFSRPLASSYEIVVMGIGVAVFTFLPYAQLRRAHIRVNLAARFMPQRLRRVWDGVIALAFAGFAGVLIWRMSLGGLDYYRYGETTSILGIPLWWAFAPVLISLFLWAAASLLRVLQLAGLIPPQPEMPES